MSLPSSRNFVSVGLSCVLESSNIFIGAAGSLYLLKVVHLSAEISEFLVKPWFVGAVIILLFLNSFIIILVDLIFGNSLLGFIHLCFDSTGMNDLKRHCAELDHNFTVDSGDTFDMGEAAGRFAYVEDPDGTLIEFKFPMI